MSEMEEVLAHYGVKGMKWGVRKRVRNAVTKARGEKLPDSPDAARKKELQAKGKRSTSSLSNKELQELVTRMNLEQQYNRLKVGDRPAVEKFIAETLVGAGKQQLSRAVNDAAANQVGDVLKKRK